MCLASAPGTQVDSLEYIDPKQQQAISADQQINGNAIEHIEGWPDIRHVAERNEMTNETQYKK